MAGRQLLLFSLMVPAWMVCTMSGWRGLRGVWPAVLVSGGSFAAVQFLAANYAGPTLGGVAAGLVSLVSLALFLRVWQPATVWRFDDEPPPAADSPARPKYTRPQIASAWVPWLLLSVCVLVWGLPSVRAMLNGGLRGDDTSPKRQPGTRPGPSLALRAGVPPPGLTAMPSVPPLAWWQRANPRLAAWIAPSFAVPQLHRRVQRGAEVVAGKSEPENALFELNWLSSHRHGHLPGGGALGVLAADCAAASSGASLAATLFRVRWALLTIACMLALAFTTQVQRGRRHAGPGLHPHRAGSIPFSPPCWAGWAWR